MADEKPSADRPAASRPRRWRASTGSPVRPYRLAFRLIGIPIIAVAGVFIYREVQNYFVLPGCDSDRAKQTLSEVLRQLKYQPLGYGPISTVSSSRSEVVCHAILPLPDGAGVIADYTFYWQGNKPNMRYSVFRQSP